LNTELMFFFGGMYRHMQHLLGTLHDLREQVVAKRNYF
jgi:hypothetical protein